MHRFPALSALILLSANLTLSAQQLQPASYSIPRQQPQEVVPTFKTTVNLVVVDVVVRDKQGHPIHGLNRDDFILSDSKTPQTIRNFEEHTQDEAKAAPATPVLPPGVFTDIQVTASNGPINVLLLDSWNTDYRRDQPNVRNQLIKFIESARPGTRMALLQLGTQLKVLQGVTEDKQLLLAALKDRDKTVSKPPPDTLREAACQTKRIESQKLVSTLDFLTLYLGNLPGRKNLLWFASGFPFRIIPFEDDDCYADITEFRQSLDRIGSVQVAIYPMKESLGFMGAPPYDLQEVARITGGRAYSNANDIDGETGAAIDDGSAYYSLSYIPQDKNWNGAYRKIEVKLANGTQADLSYRQGYLADDPNAPPRKNAIFGNGKKDPRREARPGAMEMALMLGVPEPSQVAFVTRVQPETAKEELTLAPGNNASKDTKGPYLRYAVHLAANLNTLKPVEDADGTRHLSLEFVTFVYDLKGSVVNSIGSTAQITLTAAQHQQALKDGLPLQSDVSIPSKGDYTLRVSIHDLNNDHVGAVEIPSEAIKKLPPALAAR